MEQPAFDKSFWGLVIEKGKQYKQTPKFNFHISMAVLDLTTADDSPISVSVNVDGSDFLLCNLNKERSQSRLDLIFTEGEKIKFYTTGNGNVHLTGYTMPEEDLEGFEDEDFSDEESVGSEVEKLNLLAANNKRKNTEMLKLTGKDAKKLKVEAKAPEPAKVQKVIDIDPKQLLQKKDNKAPDAQQKGKQQANQPQPKKDNKPQAGNKPAKKDDSEDDDDDDLSIDEDEESVDINNIQAMMDDDDSDEVDDDDLESDDDDLDSDEDEADVAKLKQIKGGLNKSNQAQQTKPAGKPQKVPGSPGFQKKPQQPQQQNKPQQQQQQQQQHNKPKQQNGQPNKFGNQNKTPQQNKGQTPQNKSQQKHQQTPFHKGQQNSNKKQHSPFQHQNKSFGSHNKKPFKKNAF